MFRTLRFYHSFFKFLSTPSSRRATQDQIHHLWRGGHFYPRPPRGGRHLSSIMVLFVYAFLSTPSARRATMQGLSILTGIITFLSTPSARRATRRTWKRQWRRPISIHALREEGDWSRLIWGWAQSNFYPRPPRGGRPEHRAHRAGVGKISINALREEGDSERG